MNLVFTVQSEHSCAMTGNGDAAAARPVDIVRSLDTTGGYARNQGGTVVAYTLSTNERNKSQGPANYVPVAFNWQTGQNQEQYSPDVSPSLHGGQNEVIDNLQVAATLLGGTAEGGPRTTDLNGNFQTTPMGVRRLTPLECERLQNFPDGWTCLCGGGSRGSQHCACPDTPRYRMLGNAVTVSVARWIAERMLAVARAEISAP